MSDQVRRLQLDKWSEAFGLPSLKAIDRVFWDSKLVWLKKGFRMEYDINGNDLEGLMGRLNTDFHVDVMGYAIRKLREAGFLEKGAKFAALIDDGACALSFPFNTTKKKILTALEYIEEIYKFFSFELAWDKTYVSSDMYVFLNEVFYKQRKITPGVKAFLRIRTTEKERIACALREHNKLQAMVRGSIASGTPIQLAVYKYAFEFGKLHLRWLRKRKELPQECVLMSFLPVAFGGFGAPSAHLLTSNISEDALTTSVGVLKAICVNDKSYAGVVNKLLRRPIRTKDPLAILRSPASVHVDAPHLTDNRELPYVETAIRKIVKNEFMRETLAASERFKEASIELLRRSNDRARLATIKKAYMSSPLFVVDSFVAKFERSSTLLNLLGPKTCFRIAMSYRAEYFATLGSLKNV